MDGEIAALPPNGVCRLCDEARAVIPGLLMCVDARACKGIANPRRRRIPPPVKPPSATRQCACGGWIYGEYWQCWDCYLATTTLCEECGGNRHSVEYDQCYECWEDGA